MPKGKSKQTRRAEEWAKQRSEQGISWKTVAAILGSITFLVGAIVNWMDFINKFREDYQQFLWLIIVLFGVIWFIVLWLLFKQRNIYGTLWLAVTVLAGVVVWNGWHSYIQTREAKLVVLIAKFDGPEEVYGLRNEIWEKLGDDYKNDPEVMIETVNEVIKPDSGSNSKRAVKLGEDLQADIVIWGWYRPTQNPNVNIHIENLSPQQFSTESVGFCESAHLRPNATIVDLESFTFQQQFGAEISRFISMLSGLLKYNSKDYRAAIDFFDKSISDNSESFIYPLNSAYLHFYRASSYLGLKDYNQAVVGYSEAIRLEPKFVNAYVNRGVVYSILDNKEEAVSDFSTAINLNPQYPFSYVDRGFALLELKDYDRAFEDFNKAIQLDPRFSLSYYGRGNAAQRKKQFDQAIVDFSKSIELDSSFICAYNNRGGTFISVKKYDQAIADYSKIIQLNPQFYSAYTNRGLVYVLLNQYDQAVLDFEKAIQLNPMDATNYFNRATVYFSLNQYDQAIADYTRVIQINPEYAFAYLNRGNLYKELNKTAEAEADFKKYEELTGEKP